MSFETLYSRVLKRRDQKYYLLQKEVYIEEVEPKKVLKDEIGNIIPKDAVGNPKEQWQEIQELKGVVQHRQTEKITESGQESTIRYYGYFQSDFSLNTNKLANYRVKYVSKNETLYLKIIEYDANNYLREKQHHTVLVMEEDRKYFDR